MSEQDTIQMENSDSEELSDSSLQDAFNIPLDGPQ